GPLVPIFLNVASVRANYSVGDGPCGAPLFPRRQPSPRVSTTSSRGSIMKKLLLIGLIVVGGLFLAKKTSLCSYAGTFWSRVRHEAKNQVPVKFELDRIRNEIARMDSDLQNMLSPIAENMVAVKRLKKDIEVTRGRLDEQKASLLTMTKDLEGNPRFITY